MNNCCCVCVVVAMAVLFFVGLTSMTQKATPNYPCKEVCAYFVSIGLFSGQGACMSACNVCTNKGQGDVLTELCMRKFAAGISTPPQTQTQP